MEREPPQSYTMGPTTMGDYAELVEDILGGCPFERLSASELKSYRKNLEQYRDELRLRVVAYTAALLISVPGSIGARLEGAGLEMSIKSLDQTEHRLRRLREARKKARI